jgi:hypothetical protein
MIAYATNARTYTTGTEPDCSDSSSTAISEAAMIIFSCDVYYVEVSSAYPFDVENLREFIYISKNQNYRASWPAVASDHDVETARALEASGFPVAWLNRKQPPSKSGFRGRAMKRRIGR